MYQYSQVLLDHFKRPRHIYADELDQSQSHIGYAEKSTSLPEAVLQLWIVVDVTEDVAEQVIQAARFKAYGCGATIAVGSWLCEWLHDKSLQTARELHNSDIMEALVLPAEKVHCAVLAQGVIRAAIDDYKQLTTNDYRRKQNSD